MASERFLWVRLDDATHKQSRLDTTRVLIYTKVGYTINEVKKVSVNGIVFAINIVDESHTVMEFIGTYVREDHESDKSNAFEQDSDYCLWKWSEHEGFFGSYGGSRHETDDFDDKVIRCGAGLRDAVHPRPQGPRRCVADGLHNSQYNDSYSDCYVAEHFIPRDHMRSPDEDAKALDNGVGPNAGEVSCVKEALDVGGEFHAMEFEKGMEANDGSGGATGLFLFGDTEVTHECENIGVGRMVGNMMRDDQEGHQKGFLVMIEEDNIHKGVENDTGRMMHQEALDLTRLVPHVQNGVGIVQANHTECCMIGPRSMLHDVTHDQAYHAEGNEEE
ncbi:hypothetical protein VNO78_20757 [Psophocarpus tetragonolobus]|uniref:Uncharacterized protein n=1 Tax=Psophocarpus tetragonolobus TaxID=3891 RepID=A0AAN9S9U5_PSOTE